MAVNMSKTPTISARMRVRGTEEVNKSFDDVKAKGEQTFGALRRSAQTVGTAVQQTADVAVNTTKIAVSTATTGVSVISSVLSGLAGAATFVVNAVLGIAGAIAKGATLVAGAAVGAYVAARSWVTSIAEGNDEVARQAQAIGMSVESLSRWQAAIRIAGGDSKAVVSAFESVRNKMLEVAKGTQGADTAFRQLDIRVRNSNGSLKNSEELFDEAIDQLAKISDEGIRSSAAYDLFGSAATSLLPVLRRGSAGLKELQRDAERYGTALTTAQAAENNALLEKKRRMDEALRGASNRISDAFLPIFTASATSIANWLEANGGAIETWANKAAITLSTFLDDVKSLFGDPSARELTHTWLADLQGPAQVMKGLILDIIDSMAGRGVSRTPWLYDFIDTIGEAYNASKSLVFMWSEMMGILDEDFDLAQNLRDATAALMGFQQGLAGGDSDVLWASNLGQTVALLSVGVGALAGTVADNKEQITAFAIDVSSAFADLADAIRGILNGGGVAEGNSFAWLEPVVAQVIALFEQVKAVGVEVWSEIVRNWDTLQAVGQGIIDVMDGIAKALGLGDWKTLGIILVIAQLTGALKLVSTLAVLFGGLATVVNNAIGIIAGLWPVIAAVGAKVGAVLMPMIASVAAFLGIPVAVVIGIAAAIAGIIALLVIFQGDIGAVFRFIWDVIRWPFERLWELNQWVWARIGDAAKAAVDGLKVLFAPLGGFFGAIFDGIGSIFSGAWDLLSSGAQRAWDGITGVFSGFGDFFRGLVDQVTGMFTGLWDGLKNGAAGAWDAVKGFFGFGGEPAPGNGGPSYDVGTARVPGADGQPMRATIHGGERILTVAENKKWGSLLDSLASLTTLPVSEFALGPTAVPTGAGGGGGSGLQPVNVQVGGRTYSMQGQPLTVRSFQSGVRRHARMMAMPAPRWRTS
ncbi:hypothetical protein [Devosia faecipullorum]|uniref:hypothetical protein n=1 Tax=Devosia faecipullorum TaxID=2755039 RepID=UPI00187B7E77|nr:hypothetical protein [Devosia faecipullorum]MBE7732178.1 hypothetical protein [Devosia faecipullorum]